MANELHRDVLVRGVEAWNSWREQGGVEVKPDLRKAELSGANLREANFSGANLSGANLSETDLYGADLYGADLSGADLTRANLSEANLSTAWLQKAALEGANLRHATLTSARLEMTDLCNACLAKANLVNARAVSAEFSRACLVRADLSEADVSGANFSGANLTKARFGWTRLTYAIFRDAVLKDAHLTQAILLAADLSGADLSEANLERVLLVDTNLDEVTLTKCSIHGLSAWNIRGTPKDQTSLVITREGEPEVTVDNLELAQFVYLLLNNEKLSNVIETMTSKAVLILGNFSEERKADLEEIRNQLRERDYLPIMFDFTGPQNQRFIDTVTTVARLSRFVIADLTQSRSVTSELTVIVDNLPLLPVQPLILRPEEPPHAFITDVVVSDSVLKLYRYASVQDLLASFDEAIVDPALKKRDELEVKRVRAIEEKL